MKALIVAGGKGERLKPLTNKVPKAMIQIGGRPILEHVINLFKRNGVVDFVLALCYLPESIISYFKDGSKFGVKISYTFEKLNLPLGTAGAILPSKRLISGPFIVTYADILRNLNVKDMIRFHRISKSLATINIYKHKGANFKSSIKFNKDNILTAFDEFENSQDLNKGYKWSNGSLYIFEPEIFKQIPKNRKSDFSKDIFPKLLKLNKKISVYPSSGYFIDIGTIKNKEKFQQDLKANPLILDD